MDGLTDGQLQKVIEPTDLDNFNQLMRQFNANSDGLVFKRDWIGVWERMPPSPSECLYMPLHLPLNTSMCPSIPH